MDRCVESWRIAWMDTVEIDLWMETKGMNGLTESNDW